MTEAERMEEGRRMFQIFAARMFEQRVLTAYREKVSSGVVGEVGGRELIVSSAGRVRTSEAAASGARGGGATGRGEGAQEGQGEPEEEGQEEVRRRVRSFSLGLLLTLRLYFTGTRSRRRRKSDFARSEEHTSELQSQ